MTVLNNLYHKTQFLYFQIVNKPELPDFVQYTMQNVVPCCFTDFFKQSIDMNDAQQVLVSHILRLHKITQMPCFFINEKKILIKRYSMK